VIFPRTAFKALACVLAATLLIAAAPEPQLQELDELLVTGKVAIRLEDFVEFPKYDSVAVSPDGSRLAMAWIDDNYQRQMAVIGYPSLKPLQGYALAPTYSLADVSWASDSRLVLQPYWPLRTFRRLREPIGVIMTSDVNGANKNFVNGDALALGDPLGTGRRDEEALAAMAQETAPDAGKWPGRNSLGPVRVVATHAGDPDSLLFQTTRNSDRSGNGEGFGAFLLNLRDNRQTRVATLPVPGGQFITGPEHRVALATGVNAQNQQVVYYLPPAVRAAGKDWQLVVRGASGARGLRPIAWTGTGEQYYALDGRDTPTRAVVVWDAADNTERLLYRDPDVDMESAALDPSGKAWMFQGSDFTPVYWYPDPDHPLARLHRTVAQKAPGEQVDIVSASDDLAVAVVRVSSGRRPPVYLIVNVGTGSSIAGLFTYPTLRGRRLARVEPIEFHSRDGMTIHGFLTTPEDGNGKALTGLPLLVIAHDGPLGEPAQASYEYERQLFASRGYAVLQVNRRGSPGRGTAFERAGDGKWGRQTQDDFIDGVRWALRDGVAAADRVCFYGTGFGAYSAMVAAAREPGLFKCVIGAEGVYDLPAMLGDGKREIAPALAQVLGTNMDELKLRSPVNFAASIKAKVFLVPQQNDEYFPAEQSNHMRSALRSAGNAPQVQMIGTEYGGQHSPQTRANGYAAILKFLDQQIGH